MRTIQKENSYIMSRKIELYLKRGVSVSKYSNYSLHLRIKYGSNCLSKTIAALEAHSVSQGLHTVEIYIFLPKFVTRNNYVVLNNKSEYR